RGAARGGGRPIRGSTTGRLIRSFRRCSGTGPKMGAMRRGGPYLAGVLALATAPALAACSSASHSAAGHRRGARSNASAPGLRVRALTHLPAPVQLPAAAGLGGGRALVLGGLNASDA